jgi:hypothetical protein
MKAGYFLTIISVIAALITIYGFITGIFSLKQILHNTKPANIVESEIGTNKNSNPNMSEEKKAITDSLTNEKKSQNEHENTSNIQDFDPSNKNSKFNKGKNISADFIERTTNNKQKSEDFINNVENLQKFLDQRIYSDVEVKKIINKTFETKNTKIRIFINDSNIRDGNDKTVEEYFTLLPIRIKNINKIEIKNYTLNESGQISFLELKEHINN